MLYSGRLLHKSVDWMKMHSGKLGTMPHSWISIYVVHFVTAWSVKYISFIHSALWEREEGPNPFLPARDHLWRAGESGRVKKGVEDIVSLLNRKLHNICSFAYREGVNGQLCVFVQKVLRPARQHDIIPFFTISSYFSAMVFHYSVTISFNVV